MPFLSQGARGADASQLPSYEERSVQMEPVLKHAVSAHTYGEQDSGLR